MRLAADPASVPIFINVRDRVTHLRELVAWLERAGQQRITLLDNDSSYPPLLEYLEASPHTVVRLGCNHGSRALWDAELEPVSEPFVYTDPDIVPTETCPLDLVGHLAESLERHPEFIKAGVGLYLEDCPRFISYNWEVSLQESTKLIGPELYRSQVDTTLAFYLPRPFTYQAIRTGAPYFARHLPWYNLGNPNDEDRYYLERATTGPFGSMWATVLPQIS